MVRDRFRKDDRGKSRGGLARRERKTHDISVEK